MKKFGSKLETLTLFMNLQKTHFYLLRQRSKEAKPGMRILEIGTGSGFVSVVLLANLKDITVAATEINPHAALCAKRNGVQVIRTDLFKGIKLEIPETRFDLILFNPPYLPTCKEEKVEGWLNYAFDGGISGRET